MRELLALGSAAQLASERDTEAGIAQRTLVLAVLRGALLDLLATGDRERTTRAVRRALGGLAGGEKPLPSQAPG